MSEPNLYITSLDEAKRFIRDCLISVGASWANADIVADNLVIADYRGHFSHGMSRLSKYVRDIQTGFCDPTAIPKILKESPSTAWIDGQNGLGAVIGKHSMEVAISKAKTTGIGWVAVKGSNHYGIAGIFAEQASKEGLLGMSFTNTSPVTCPTRAKEPCLGTNPLCLSAPTKNGDTFCLDMATTAVAMGKVEIKKRKNEELPIGWGLNVNAELETNPDKVLNGGMLLPLGGLEDTSGYKGYGLAMLVEIFTGICAGANYRHNIRNWNDCGSFSNLGHCFVAIDPVCFAPGFQERMSDLNDFLRHMDPVDPEKPVLIPGDPERLHMQKTDAVGGISYISSIYESCDELADVLSVQPICRKNH